MPQAIRRVGTQAALLIVIIVAQGCRRGSELPRPTPDQVQRITAAVDAYLAAQATRDRSLTLHDPAMGTDQTVRVGRLGQPRVVRSRYYVVPAAGTTREQEGVDIAFFVLETGPVYVVDTALIAPMDRVRFGP